MDETLVSFGSHTPEHTILTLERQEKVKSLVAQSKTEISQELGKDIVLFSYPNGSYDNRIKEAVRECGFICGLTTDYGSNGPGADLLELKRIPIGSGDTLVSFVAGLSGIRRYASGLISLLRRLKRARHG
jgi:peptidoglycan/xylan/chitin deacetylase (PgdA/CDA1 family)